MKACFAALALSLFATSALAQANCPEEQGLRSINSELPSAITFINGTLEDVQVFWIDFEGAKQRYGWIAPGQSHLQQTYVSHPWAVYNRHGECLGVFFPEAAPRVVRVGPVG